ncbi:MAG: O-antigen ligase-like protein [Thermoanaerobacterales bacterium 50_218]|nr:MAG: O-antigen ligase-like protein [Thermoanaerobacterales bacterium 50_218]HAA89288.1 polymerase [Peptococcaceae bacterium]
MSTARNISNCWNQSLCSRFFKFLLESFLKSRTFRFITGPGLSEQCSYFQDTATYRALAGFSRLITLLRRVSFKAAQASISNLISESLVWNYSYLIFFLIAAYPLVDYILRNQPGTSALSGIWDELVFLVTGLLLLGRFLIDEGKRFSFTPLDLPILLFVGAGIFLFLVKSPEPDVALDGWRATYQYVFWFFLTVSFGLTSKQRQQIIWAFVLVGTLVAFYGIYQYIIGVPIPPNWVDQAEAGVRTRVFSWIGSPNVLGSYLVLLIPVAAALFHNAGSWRAKAAAAAILLGMALCLVFTFSRGAWLAFLLAALVYGTLRDRRLLALILVGAVLLPVVSPSVANRLQYTFSSKYVESSQRGGRFARWEEALERFSHQPVTGVGLGRFGGATAARFNIPGTFYVDNYYLKVAVETGLIGVGTFLWLLLNVLRTISGILKELAREPGKYTLSCGIAAGLLGVLAHNLVENIFEVPMMQTAFWVLLGILVTQKPNTHS